MAISAFAQSPSSHVHATVTCKLMDARIVSSSHQHQIWSDFSTSARRRRRRGGGGGSLRSMEVDGASDDDANAPPSPAGRPDSVLSPDQFLLVANSLLDQVQSAVAKLQDCNDGLEVTRHAPSSPAARDGGASIDDEESEESQTHGGRLAIQVESTGDLYWGGGTYWLTIHPDAAADGSSRNEGSGAGGFVSLQSPLSGTYSYVYDTSTREWVGSEDGHSLLGMFTRDWIRQCRGVPDF